MMTITYFPFIFSVCLIACNADTSLKKSNSAMLTLNVKIPSSPIARNQPFMVNVILMNTGESPVLINNRMALGYPKSISRELFLTIEDVNGNPAYFDEVDYNRDEPKNENYVNLNPSDSVIASFELFKYYPLKNPGNYKITVHYQADESSVNLPSGVWNGILSSDPIFIEILPGRMPKGN